MFVMGEKKNQTKAKPQPLKHCLLYVSLVSKTKFNIIVHLITKPNYPEVVAKYVLGYYKVPFFSHQHQLIKLVLHQRKRLPLSIIMPVDFGFFTEYVMYCFVVQKSLSVLLLK